MRCGTITGRSLTSPLTDCYVRFTCTKHRESGKPGKLCSAVSLPCSYSPAATIVRKLTGGSSGDLFSRLVYNGCSCCWEAWATQRNSKAKVFQILTFAVLYWCMTVTVQRQMCRGNKERVAAWEPKRALWNLKTYFWKGLGSFLPPSRCSTCSKRYWLYHRSTGCLPQPHKKYIVECFW